MVEVLLVDNYDSFVHNIAQYLGELGAGVHIRRNDTPLKELEALEPDRIVLGPGPGRPEDSGVCLDILDGMSRTIPTLGICLGHQAIVVHFGGKVGRAPRLMHGRTSPIFHDGKGPFCGIPSPFTGGRYHSLIALESGDELEISARTDRGECMAVRHTHYPIHGFQFHPESILSRNGHRLLANFLEGPV